MTAEVNALGDGYLVVADALQSRGWSVSVDGSRTRLMPANHGMVAVAVPEGRHIVRFRYEAPGQKTGLVVSIVAAVIILWILLLDSRLMRQRPLQVSARHAQPVLEVQHPEQILEVRHRE
jgi:uncharacterized membrane protein YfhO